MDDTGGREWYFENILKNDKTRIVEELRKSYSEIGFDFMQKLAEKYYRKLLKKYQLDTSDVSN